MNKFRYNPQSNATTWSDAFRFARQSNRATWRFSGQLVDDNGDPVDLTGKTFKLGVCDNDGWPCLAGTTADNRIVSAANGMFSWAFTPDEMWMLCLGTYHAGLTILDGAVTTQIIYAPLPVIDGNTPWW